MSHSPDNLTTSSSSTSSSWWENVLSHTIDRVGALILQFNGKSDDQQQTESSILLSERSVGFCSSIVVSMFLSSSLSFMYKNLLSLQKQYEIQGKFAQSMRNRLVSIIRGIPIVKSQLAHPLPGDSTVSSEWLESILKQNGILKENIHVKSVSMDGLADNRGLVGTMNRLNVT